MTPWQLAKETEHSHQRAFFAWANCAATYGFIWASNPDAYSIKTRQAMGRVLRVSQSQLTFMFAIPNGGKRDALTGAMMKAEGVKRGAPDVMLPVTGLAKAGLFLEFKKPSAKPKKTGAGGVREEQSDYHTFLRSQHYRVEVVYSWIEAANVVMEYMGERLRIP